MQPPAARTRHDGRLASATFSRDRKASGGSPNEHAPVSVVEDSHNDLQIYRHRQSQMTRNVLSGRLSRCSPVFSPSSDMVLCSCSSSVLGVSVETGEQVLVLRGSVEGKRWEGKCDPYLRGLEGHSADVTGMLVLPPGVYEGNVNGGDNEAGGTRRASHGRPLLTSSMDGTMRVWDISVNPLSLEDEKDRCLHIFLVGRPVYHLYLGRQDSTGAALDVIIVTKERASFSGESGMMSTGVKDNEGGDDDKGNSDGDSSDSVDKEDDFDRNKHKGGGALELKRKAAFVRGKGMRNGMQHLIGWKVTRYGVAPGVSTAVIVEALDQRRWWVGAVSALSPLRSSRSDGVSKMPMTYPILLTADGRNVIARDSKTGDKVLLLRSFGRICTMDVCGGGDSLLTGHTEGSMAHWQGLQERLGAAFRVSGYEGARNQPVVRMHWHASAVGCLGVASDGVQMFSGGEEAVLVQWNLSKGTKAFLPRLGSPLKELAVSPAQEHVVVCSTDNAITLVGLAEWDVLWQMRGLALDHSRSAAAHAPSSSLGSVEEAFSDRRALRLTLEPKRGLLACNGRAGHVQFYNVGTDCLEASVEVERFNRDSSGKTYFTQDLKSKRHGDKAASAFSGGPVVERVAFSRDGKRMVAVASRLRAAGSTPIPRLSFWKHAQGSDPCKTPGYVGSYNGARSTSKNVKKDDSGGTWGHWAPDTSVDNPHGPGKALSALEYHPVEDVVVTAGEDGAFNLWGLKRSPEVERPLVAHPYSSGRAGAVPKGDEKKEPAVHWACSLSIRYKEGFSATDVSFSSDGSVLAVAYSPETPTSEAMGKSAHVGSQGVITLWSLDTITLLSTLLPPRALDIPSSMPRRLESVAFLSECGRIFACGDDYAAVWELFSEQPTPLWEYRGRFLAAATADVASVFRSGKAGIRVEGQGLGDVVLCVDAKSLAGETKKQGSVVLLLDSRRPTPLYTWRLPYDNPTCVRLLLGGPHSGGKEGVLCLTRRGELLFLSVASETGDVSSLSPTPKIGAQYGLGVVRSRHSVKTLALRTGNSNAAKQKLLDVDLSAIDPALSGRGEGRKRPRISGGARDDRRDDGYEDEDVGHAGGREAALWSGRKPTDILDPSSLNLAPVSDLYEPFMKTLLKPAPQSSQKAWEAHPLLKGKGKKARQGSHGAKAAMGARKGQRAKARPMEVDKGLLAALMEEMKVAGTSS